MRERYERYLQPWWSSRSTATISAASTARSCWSTCSARSIAARPASPTPRRRSGPCCGSFRYGPSGLLARLLRPRIETLLFAVSKADHVAHNQHHNLRLLLERMVEQAAGGARFEGVKPAFVALAALRSTDVVRTEHHGQALSCVRGVLKGEKRETVLFPGEIPPDLPAEEDWRRVASAFATSRRAA